MALPQKRQVIIILLWIIIIFLILFRLGDFPRVWWDEGWYLDAARNWIEQGHFGHYLDGQPIPPRIPVRFPVAVPVAASMKIFGIGAWQGRLPGAIFTILSLGMLVYLSTKIYNRKVGIVTLIAVVCLSPIDFNPIFLGRQIQAEMPMFFYLLGGYLMIWFALRHSPAWGVGASVLFGVAIHAKLQVPPFWLVSIILAIWIAAKYKQKSAVKILGGIALGSILVLANHSSYSKHDHARFVFRPSIDKNTIQHSHIGTYLASS